VASNNNQIAPRWRKKLEESLAAGHDTWLHQLFLGTIALEEGDVVKASSMLTKSLEMHPHPITARNLASFAGVAPALAYYQMAFSLWKEMDGEKDTVKTLLGRDLVSEYAIWLTYKGMTMELDELLSDKEVSVGERCERYPSERCFGLSVQEDSEMSSFLITSLVSGFV
jgi:hypothetical protein